MSRQPKSAGQEAGELRSSWEWSEKVDGMLTAHGKFPYGHGASAPEVRFHAERRDFATPMPRPGPLHVPLAQAVAERPRVGDHDDHPLACDPERFQHDCAGLK